MLALLICAFVWMRFGQSAYVIAKVAIGEGGGLHSAGTIQATYNANAIGKPVRARRLSFTTLEAIHENNLLFRMCYDDSLPWSPCRAMAQYWTPR